MDTFPANVFNCQKVDFSNKTSFSITRRQPLFPSKMATLTKKFKLAALNKKIVRSILGVTWHKAQ